MSANSRRPKSVQDVSLRVRNGVQAFDPALREFLDFFYANPELHAASLQTPPLPLDELRDAYLAATAEHLAHCYRLPTPEWAETLGCQLKRPFFAGGLESLKALLTVESPAAFRRRMLFVSRDALFRPRANADSAAD